VNLKVGQFQINAILDILRREILLEGNAIIDFLFPELCLVCAKRLNPDEHLLCENCWKNLPRVPFEYSITSEIKSRSNLNCYLSSAFSIFEFSNDLKQIIHLLKYEHMTKCAVYIVHHISPGFLQAISQRESDLIIPVPLHIKRKAKRGYNQSALIGKELSKLLHVPLGEKCLIRTINTKSQTKLDINDRIQNVADAFSVVDPEAIHDKKILLVDDVITTGSTVSMCAKEILSSGAKRVDAFSLAKVM